MHVKQVLLTTLDVVDRYSQYHTLGMTTGTFKDTCYGDRYFKATLGTVSCTVNNNTRRYVVNS